MSDFPIICIPSSLQLAQASRPPEDPFSEKPPDKPGAEPQTCSGMGVALQTFAAAIITPAMSSMLGISGWLLFISAVGAIAWIAWRQHTSYPTRKQAYRFQVESYSRELPAYKKRKYDYEEKQKANAPKRTAQWRREQMQLALACTASCNGNHSSAREGYSEKSFRSHLERYFSGKIHAGLTHQIPGSSYSYTPDASYIDSNINLCIDIEVDEPYVYRSGKPIHYDGYETDLNRDQFFKNKGWIVIRFSEQQVVRHPDSCCKTVAQQIAQVTEDSSILNHFVNIPELPKQRQWTEGEAVQMAAENARDNYHDLPRGVCPH